MGIVVAIAVVLCGAGLFGRMIEPNLRLARGTLVGALVMLVVSIASTSLRVEWRFWLMAGLALLASVAVWPDTPAGEPRRGLVRAVWGVPILLALGLELRTGLPVARAAFSAIIVGIAQAALGFGMAVVGRSKQAG